MHWENDSTQRRPNIFLLNGRSFSFTLRDMRIEVKAGEPVGFCILNAGARTVYLHSHGHHLTLLAKGDVMVIWKLSHNRLQRTRRCTWPGSEQTSPGE